MEVSLLVEEGEHPSDLVAELELGCRGGTEYYSKLLMWRVNNESERAAGLLFPANQLLFFWGGAKGYLERT